MPLSIFRGRELPAPGEPLWLDDDRDWALALQAYEADLCHGCGQPLALSTAAANEYGFTVEHERCHACAAMRREGRRLTAEAEGRPAFADGLRLTVRPD